MGHQHRQLRGGRLTEQDVMVESADENEPGLAALRVSDGEPRWEHTMPSRRQPSVDNLRVYGDITVLDDRAHITVFDGGGRILFDKDATNDAVTVVRTGDLVVMSYTEPAGTPTLTAIGARDGAARWSVPLAVAAMAVVGGGVPMGLVKR